MLTALEILAQIEDQGGLKLGPAKLTLYPLRSIPPDENPRYVSTAIASFQTCISGKEFFFTSATSAISTPKTLWYAIDKAKQRAKGWGRTFSDRTYLPLVITPYLPQDRLDELQDQECCGIDLCGNGVIVAEGVLIYRTGKPNRYPNTAEIRNVYRLKSALVPRSFILKPTFGAIKELVEFINARDGDITFPTVSKVLKKLEEDLVIAREAKSIRQIQPEKILDALGANYRPPKITNTWLGRCNTASLTELLAPLQQVADAKEKRFVLTGAASANQYCTFGGELIVSVYTDASIAPLLDAAGGQYEEGKRFANLEIIQTFSDWVYFDPRDKDGIQVASPIQAYVELANGDPRQRQAADQIRQRILADLTDRSESQ
jgi:hypothetical protein